jgi:hypothetical protein
MPHDGTGRIPEVNPGHIDIIPAQRRRLGTERGFITAKPNCSIQPYVPALYALADFGPQQVSVCTYQAVSGAGRTLESWPEMADNVIPFIGGEEEKSEREPLKIWGHIDGERILEAQSPTISAQCVRVPVSATTEACSLIDLRDHYGLTQLVFYPDSSCYEAASRLSRESVVTATGPITARSKETINPDMPTGEIELPAEEFTVLSAAGPLPFPIAEEEHPAPEAQRLEYHFLDLRRQGMHSRIELRAQIIASIRRRMTEMGFLEMQTPILTSSSPEGARDFLVPSRLYPGQFYALPQSPQQFKQQSPQQRAGLSGLCRKWRPGTDRLCPWRGAGRKTAPGNRRRNRLGPTLHRRRNGHRCRTGR